MIDVKAKICDLLRETQRMGVHHLIDYMENSGFFTAPCSTQFHLAEPGGLAEHSLNVFHTASTINTVFRADIPPDSLIISCLLHDLGKCGQFGKPEYSENVLKSGKRSGTKPYEKNKTLLPVDHEVRSVAIASQFIQLTEEEQYAILMHNGLYGPFKYGLQGRETKLQMVVHFADMWASRIIEVSTVKEEE